MLSLLEVGRVLGGITTAEVCDLIVSRALAGTLVDGRLMVDSLDLRTFIASQQLWLVPSSATTTNPGVKTP